MSGVAAVLGAGGAATSRVMDRVEARMGELARENGPVLARYAGQTIAAGGKRLRPLLVCLAAGVPPPEGEEVVRAGVAVELIHSATLVHDDVLDRAALRRGRPTVYALGGRGAAVAAGDLLFSRAFAELAAGGMIEAIRVLAEASVELANGELLQRGDAWDVSVTSERYLERCRLKTGVLFRAACALGALAGGGEVATLAAFGERIGVAFQLLDDVLDIGGSPEQTGKPRGTDLLDGTVTLPLILARRADAALAARDPRTIVTAQQATEVCDAIAATGALERCREAALTRVAEAKETLRGLPGDQRRALELAADGVVERYS